MNHAIFSLHKINNSKQETKIRFPGEKMYLFFSRTSPWGRWQVGQKMWPNVTCLSFFWTEECVTGPHEWGPANCPRPDSPWWLVWLSVLGSSCALCALCSLCPRGTRGKWSGLPASSSDLEVRPSWLHWCSAVLAASTRDIVVWCVVVWPCPDYPGISCPSGCTAGPCEWTPAALADPTLQGESGGCPEGCFLFFSLASTGVLIQPKRVHPRKGQHYRFLPHSWAP